MFGQGQTNYRLLTAELITEFDVVITIGKTVQYALVAGVPVFVYDHFGGFGYLDQANLAAAADRNFSGRGGERLAARTIAERVLTGYAAARDFQSANRPAFRSAYALGPVLDQVLREAGTDRPALAWPPAFGLATRSAQRFAARFYQFWGERDQARAEIHVLSQELATQRDRSARLEAELSSARARETDLIADGHRLAVEVEALRESWSYRIGNQMVRPFSMIRGTFTPRPREVEESQDPELGFRADAG